MVLNKLQHYFRKLLRKICTSNIRKYFWLDSPKIMERLLNLKYGVYYEYGAKHRYNISCLKVYVTQKIVRRFLYCTNANKMDSYNFPHIYLSFHDYYLTFE